MNTIDGQLYETCQRMKNKAALQHKISDIWQSITYATLWKDSDQITAGLQNVGIKKGDRIAILAPPSPRWVTAYLAILKADGIVVPIDKELKGGEIRHILSDCEARIVFTEGAYVETVVALVPVLPKLEKIVIMYPEDDNKIADPVLEMTTLSRWLTSSMRFCCSGNFPSPKAVAKCICLAAWKFSCASCSRRKSWNS